MAAAETIPHGRVVLRRAEEVRDLMAELRRCLRESRRTGGMYSTTVSDTGGKITISVWVPPR